jgi:hypothetical protein
MLAVSAVADAQTVRVRTETVGRGTQLRRSDLTRDAERFLSQSASVWAWNAAPGLLGTLDLHVSARYQDDLGIAAEDRQNPFVETERSRFFLDIAQARYRPVTSVSLTAGRQWVTSALGTRDIDGVRLRWSPKLAGDVRSWVDGYAGYEVVSGWATVNSDAWDVQGLPVDPAGGASGGIRGGVDAGLSLEHASFDVAWQRQVAAGGEGAVGDERVGMAVSGNPHERVVVGSSASYHVVLDAVDRADLRVSWREPLAETVLSAGAEHRLPWFDASSIFNVFGARPFEGAYLTWQVPSHRLRTSFDLRGWGRAYDANLDLADLGAGEGDARAFGGGAGHDTRFRAFDREWTWRSYASGQSSVDRNQGGTQWLADTRLRFPVVGNRLTIESRFLGIALQPGRTSSFGPGRAFTTVFGVEVPVSFGTFRAHVEGQSSTYYGGNLNAYATFGTELWL